MTKNSELSILGRNPQNILGVSPAADAVEIRTAYLNKIKEYPPEKFPAEFEQVRDAYAILSDVRCRSRLMLQSADPHASLETLIDNQKPKREFVGAQAWLAAMRER